MGKGETEGKGGEKFRMDGENAKVERKKNRGKNSILKERRNV